MRPNKNAIKRIMAILLIATSFLTLCACSHAPFDYDLNQYIVVGDISKITISSESIEALVAEYKEELLNAHATESEAITDRQLKIGDVAVVSYKCYLGESLIMPIAESTSPTPVLEDTNCHIVLGRGKYPSVIEDAILSAKAPATYTGIHYTFPKNFEISDLAGKSVVFDMTVTSAYEFLRPEYNDLFVSENTEYKTVAEYEAACEQKAKRQLIWNELLESSEILGYPREELNSHTLDFIEYYTNLANSQSLTVENYVKRKFFIDLAHFHLKADEFAKEYTGEQILVYKLSRDHLLDLSNDEYNAGAEKFAVKYGYNSVSKFESVYGKSFIKYSVLKEKVMDHVMNLVTATTEQAH